MEKIITILITISGLVSSMPMENVESWIKGGNTDLCKQIVIAHRGASGYVPEHTLGAYALAVTMGADYIEPDLVSTKDGHLVARHDNELSMTTDVAQHPEFADRYRNQTVDGNKMEGWFTEDFTLAELKTLRAIERIPQIRPGNARMDESYRIPTFQEILELVIGLQISFKRIIGIYPEIKHSTHFQRLGLTMEVPLVRTFMRYGYWSSKAPVYIQSFEVSNLQQLSKITNLKLIQLLESDTSLQPADQVERGTGLTYGDMATAKGLLHVAKYASAVGPDKSYIIPRDANNRLGVATSFVKDAHAAGLKVHPYTFRAENYFLPADFQSNHSLPSGVGDFESELKAYFDAGVDGLFTDQPDRALHVRGSCRKDPQ